MKDCVALDNYSELSPPIGFEGGITRHSAYPIDYSSLSSGLKDIAFWIHVADVK